MIPYTVHAELRCYQRKITRDEVDYVLQFGQRFLHGEVIHCRLHYKDLPKPDRNQDWAISMVGTELVIGKDRCMLITAYRDRSRGSKEIQRRENNSVFHRRQPYWETE